jgi:phosphoglycolate phosphatase
MPDPDFELIRRDLPRGGYKAILFDFDGTLSLLREGWSRIMGAMMVEALIRTNTRESEPELTVLVDDFVMALNGRPAIFQMARLVEEIRARGGIPHPPDDYLREYDDRLLRVVRERVREVQDGRTPPEQWTVPGSHRFLDNLCQRRMKLYLASGTLIQHVRAEADLLGLAPYFGREAHAPDEGDTGFSKRVVIERILGENGLRGEQLLGFGDGVVETEEVRRVGGTAVAVAGDLEAAGINRWKRDRLVPAGADLVIPDYRNQSRLVEWLIDGE